MAKSVRKKYKTFSSLKDLEAAQRKIKKEYADIENNAISSIFDPVSIGMNVLPMALSIFKSNKSAKQKKAERAAVKKVELKSDEAVKKINSLLENAQDVPATPNKKKNLNILNVSQNDNFGKKVFASFIRWQLVELGFWGIKKLSNRK